MQFQNRLDGQKIILYGMGVTGRSALQVLPKAGASVTVFVDGGLGDEDLQWIRSLPESENIRIVEDITDQELSDAAFALRSSGISPNTPVGQRIRKAGLDLVTDLEVAYHLFGGEKIIAITGSNGKTTTTSLVTHILTQANQPAVSCGNIGTPILTTLFEAAEGTYFVTECSSFQLEGVRQFAPHRAAILNITPDHIVWHGTFEAYALAKAAIARAQSGQDVLFLPPDDPVITKAISEVGAKAKIVVPDFHSNRMEAMRKGEGWHLLGEHNIENAAFAVAICQDMGISDRVIDQALETFRPIAHRMENIAEVNGVRYINDSKGTNVDSTVHALAGIHDPVWLIAGGYDKHVPFDELYKAFRPCGKKLLLIGETAPQIQEGAKRVGLGDCVVMAGTLAKAMEIALNEAEPGDLVLLSPASASWDQYDHFEERGDEFREIVLAWKKKWETGKE